MNQYHKEFLRSFSSGDIIELFCRYKGGAKEVTESWGMLVAAKRFCPDLSEYKVVVVGDGNTPRTGALISYNSQADVISIDPAFNMRHWNWWLERRIRLSEEPKRLEIRKCRIEETHIDCGGKKLLAIWPHSHAPMECIKVEGFTSRTDIVMPCCVKIPKSFMSRPHITYEDINVESPKRTIHVWKQ